MERIVQHVHEHRIIHHLLIIELTYRIHRLVHTVVADTDVIRQVEHSSRLAFRSAANITNIFKFFFIHSRLPHLPLSAIKSIMQDRS